MLTTGIRITLAAIAIAILGSAAITPAAHASDDLPRDPGTVSDSVMVTGSWQASGYSGGIFSRTRESSQGTFNGSTGFEVGDRRSDFARGADCAGNFFFVADAVVAERRDTGEVRVELMVNTWDSCPFTPGNDGFAIADAWVEPGESVEVQVAARSRHGSVAVRATFTNIWNPPVEPIVSLIDWASDGAIDVLIDMLNRAVVFPEWRIPQHGETSAVVYVAVVAPGASGALDEIARAHQMLAEIDRDYWPGYSGADCDRVGDRPVLLGGAAWTVGAYFEEAADAHTFAASWQRYFGEPVAGVFEDVESYCLD